jgi:tRNA nucleotidyltransferase/poly(A) polymerase
LTTEEAVDTWQAVLEALSTGLAKLGAKGWLVGGCMRDALLGRPVRDLDVAIDGDPEAIARTLQLPGIHGMAALRRATTRLALATPAGAYLDLTRLRGGSITADLAARDFTVNALALSLSARASFLALMAMPSANALPAPPALIDPLVGYADLQAQRLVPASATALTDDPGRIVRGARLAAQLGLRATSETLRHMRDAAPGLAAIPHERIGEELARLFCQPNPDAGWDILRDGGALRFLMPGVRAVPGVTPEAAEAHLLATQAALAPLHPDVHRDVHLALSDPPDPMAEAALPTLRSWLAGTSSHGEHRIVLLCWAVLAHALTSHEQDVQEAGSFRSVPSRHTTVELPAFVPGGEPRHISLLVAEFWPEAYRLLGEETIALAEWRRFFWRTARCEDGGMVAILAALACAVAGQDGKSVSDQTAGESAISRMVANARTVLRGYVEDHERWLPSPLLSGADLIRELDIPPGPAIGHILSALREAQFADTITTQHEAAALARQLVEFRH